PTEDTQQETDNEAVEDEDNDNQATEQDVEEPANEEADQDNAVEQEEQNEQADQENTDDQEAVQEEESNEEEQEGNEEQNEQADQENTDDQEAVQEEESNEEEQEGNNEADGETKTMSATAYTADCEGCSGTTADGTDLDGDEKVIAVDPDEIPLGTEVHVEGYGDAVAGDTGGAINGDKIDLHMSDEDEANDFGNQEVEVTIK